MENVYAGEGCLAIICWMITSCISLYTTQRNTLYTNKHATWAGALHSTLWNLSFALTKFQIHSIKSQHRLWLKSQNPKHLLSFNVQFCIVQSFSNIQIFYVTFSKCIVCMYFYFSYTLSVVVLELRTAARHLEKVGIWD